MAGKLTGFTVEDYGGALKRLLPQGPAWEDEQALVMSAVIDLTARELQRFDVDMARLIDESDPRSAAVTLDEWFYEWGIPDECLKALEYSTFEQWRNILILKIRTLGLTFTELLAIIANISGRSSASAERVEPFNCGSRVNDRLYGQPWEHAVLVISSSTDEIRYFRTTSLVDEALASWGNEFFECLVRSIAPAHKLLVFEYIEE